MNADMNPFVIRTYGRTELAQIYCPNLCPEAAFRKLKHWIDLCPGLRDGLSDPFPFLYACPGKADCRAAGRALNLYAAVINLYAAVVNLYTAVVNLYTFTFPLSTKFGSLVQWVQWPSGLTHTRARRKRWKVENFTFTFNPVSCIFPSPSYFPAVPFSSCASARCWRFRA